MAEKVGFAPTSRIFHDWYVSTVLPSAGLGDFSVNWRKRRISIPHPVLAGTSGVQSRGLAFRLTLPKMVDSAGLEPATSSM